MITTTAATTAAITTPVAGNESTPWVERYRPKSLHDVSHQTEVVATLQNAVRTGRLPHLLFYGPPGSGKTSVALALCRQLWHPSQWKRRVLELNASDERGISVVRDKIKQFAAQAVGGNNIAITNINNNNSNNKTTTSLFSKKNTSNNNNNNNPMEEDDHTAAAAAYPNPPFKVIILDECDSVTPDAQAALRRIIEANSRITRFILICNYVTRIIEPLASRCAKFRFQSLPPQSMKDRLQQICQAEQCPLAEAQLDTILELSEGDMRRAVQTLQSVNALTMGDGSGRNKNKNNTNTAAVLDDTTIAELVGLPPPKVVDDLVQALLNSQGIFEKVQTAVEEVCLAGYSAQTLVGCLLQRFISLPQLDEIGRAKLAIRIAEAEHCMMDGADEYLQLMTVCGLAMQCLQSSSTSMNMVTN